jgi:hypothetical protein
MANSHCNHHPKLGEQTQQFVTQRGVSRRQQPVIHIANVQKTIRMHAHGRSQIHRRILQHAQHVVAVVTGRAKQQLEVGCWPRGTGCAAVTLAVDWPNLGSNQSLALNRHPWRRVQHP